LAANILLDSPRLNGYFLPARISHLQLGLPQRRRALHNAGQFALNVSLGTAMNTNRTRTLVSFDWAAKKILRDKANFDILEGFLTTLLKHEVKIL
jgi:hypothetical protein